MGSPAKKTLQSGQALLIVVLLATVLITVGLSLSRLATEEQQISKLEEESKKATYGAEAGLEAALRQASGSVDISSLSLGSDVTGTATIQNTQYPSFTTPLLKRGEQYTFYLSNYDTATGGISDPAYNGTIIINKISPTGSYCSSPNTQFAIELTFINTTNKVYSLRRLIDECNLISGTTDEVTFGGSINLAADPSYASHVLLLRIIGLDSAFPGTKLSVSQGGGGNWPLQGKTIVSEAKTTGASRKIQLFQSYPQLPTELFVTSF